MAILVSGVKCHHLTMKVTPIQLQLVRKMFSRPSVLSPSRPPVLQAAPQPSPLAPFLCRRFPVCFRSENSKNSGCDCDTPSDDGRKGREAGTSRLLIRERTRPDSLMNQVGPRLLNPWRGGGCENAAPRGAEFHQT